MTPRAGLGALAVAYVALVLWLGEEAAGWLVAVGLVGAGAAAAATPEVRRAARRWLGRGGR